MFPSEFVDACNKALHRIGFGVGNAQLDYGQQDFPGDGGIAFRNEVYKYPHCYFRALFHYLHEESTAKWTNRNRDNVFKLTDDHLLRIVATSHFYVQARQMHLANVDPRNRHMRTVLDWLTNAYQAPAEVPQRWFKIVTTVRDHVAYWKEAQRFFYADIAYALVSGKDDEENAGLWGDVAFSADFLGFNTKDEEWVPTCQEHFAAYYEDLKRLRKPS
jgi:hypothetical protein